MRVKTYLFTKRSIDFNCFSVFQIDLNTVLAQRWSPDSLFLSAPLWRCDSRASDHSSMGNNEILWRPYAHRNPSRVYTYYSHATCVNTSRLPFRRSNAVACWLVRYGRNFRISVQLLPVEVLGSFAFHPVLYFISFVRDRIFIFVLYLKILSL